MINGSNRTANVNADGFDRVKLASSNAKMADVKAYWVESQARSSIIVDGIPLKLNAFAIKTSAWLITISA